MKTTFEEQINIAVANVEEWKQVQVYSWRDGVRLPKQWFELKDLPKYTTSHDAILPVIKKQSRATLWKMREYLIQFYTEEYCFLLATPLQLCTALLKALGKWEE